MATNYRPAGFSSDEDVSDEGFSFSEPIKFSRPRIEIQSTKKTETPLNDLDSLRIEAIHGSTHNVELLIEQKNLHVDVIIQGWTALMFASANCQYDAMKYLLKKGANPNFHQHSYTVLMSICASTKQHQAQCIQLLLDHGADVNARQHNGVTALMVACREGNDEAVAELLKRDANINAQDTMGWTPLIWSVKHAKCRQMEVVQLLLKAEADVTIKCRKGQTAHTYALNAGYHHIAAQIPVVTGDVPVSLDSQGTFTARDSWEYLRENLCGTNGKKWILWHDVAHCLNRLGIFHRYSHKFKEVEMDLVKFLTLTEDELENISVIPVHRKRLLDMTRKLHLKRWKEKSLDMRSIKNMQNEYNMIDELKLMANITRQITMIRASVVYITKQMTSCSEMEPDFRVQDMISKIESTLIKARLLHKELNSYMSYVTAELGEQKYPPDWIGSDKIKRKSHCSLLIIGVVASVIGIVMWRTNCYPKVHINVCKVCFG